MASILLINNHSKHIQSLSMLFSQYGEVTCVDKDNLNIADCSAYNLIVLSGGSDYPVHADPTYYSKQMQILCTSKVPIIGICLGAELIVSVFGGHLMQLPQKLMCTMPIQYMDPLFDGIPTTMHVAERHRWCITDLGMELIGLAKSSFGYEIIKHKTKPIYGLQFHPEIDPDCLGGDEILDKILYLLGFRASLGV